MAKKYLIAASVCFCVAAAASDGLRGTIDVDISDITGKPLTAQVDLVDANGVLQPIPVPSGRLRVRAPEGKYTARVFVFDEVIPMLVAVRPLEVVANDTAFLLVNVYEGAGGRLRLRDFDSDGDLVIDGAEIDAGTNASDPTSYPGAEPLPWREHKLSGGARWYRGELHAHSKYGEGKESVSKLIRRAEKAGLDFLAITDRNTMAASLDKDFESGKLVLIPAMEWGNDERGVALIYGPKTMPAAPAAFGDGQAVCLRLQAQGGVFAVAHPCLRELPWTWGLGYVNAVEVWYQGWRTLPPMSLSQLDEDLQAREPGSLKLVHSIAAAAAAADATPDSVMGIQLPDLGVSANRQALLFHEFEQARGLIACVIGGSGARDAKTPLAEPVTYIYAEEQSVAGLLAGMRLGRTYVSSGLDGPELLFTADVLIDGKIDVTMGGIVPVDTDVLFHVGVKNGVGKKVRLFRDGHPIATRDIDSNPYMHAFEEHPSAASSYRVAVVSVPEELIASDTSDRGRRDKEFGFGPQDFHAVSSAIYSRDITKELLERVPNLDERNVFVRIPRDTASDRSELPPAIALTEEW